MGPRNPGLEMLGKNFGIYKRKNRWRHSNATKYFYKELWSIWACSAITPHKYSMHKLKWTKQVQPELTMSLVGPLCSSEDAEEQLLLSRCWASGEHPDKSFRFSAKQSKGGGQSCWPPTGELHRKGSEQCSRDCARPRFSGEHWPKVSARNIGELCRWSSVNSGRAKGVLLVSQICSRLLLHLVNVEGELLTTSLVDCKQTKKT